MPAEFTVLIVDDDSDLSEVIVDRLQTSFPRCRCLTAPNGSAAKAVFSTSQFKIDLIISDFAMPFKNGLDFIKEIRSANPSIPCILITGVPNNDIFKKSMNLNIVDVIIKPFDTQDLINTVEKALESSKKTA